MSARYKNTEPLCTLSSIGGTARSGIHPIDFPPVARLIHSEFAKSTQSIEIYPSVPGHCLMVTGFSDKGKLRIRIIKEQEKR